MGPVGDLGTGRGTTVKTVRRSICIYIYIYICFACEARREHCRVAPEHLNGSGLDPGLKEGWGYKNKDLISKNYVGHRWL